MNIPFSVVSDFLHIVIFTYKPILLTVSVNNKTSVSMFAISKHYIILVVKSE